MGLIQPRTLCVVPARGGSKRVPRKNVRPIGGVPMIAHTLGAILRSGVADRVVVSTDDDEIAAVAEQAGADVPFKRPAHLADDHTPTAPVIAHAIDALAEEGDAGYDLVLVVYATALLLNADDLRAARDAIGRAGFQLAMSVCRYTAPIDRAWRKREDGTGAMLKPEFALTRTQDLEATYYDAGQFYLGTSGFWASNGAIASANPVLIEVPVWRAVDIDTEDDLRFAELLLMASDERLRDHDSRPTPF